ncbi:DUF2510 domain-containing protein [Demequina sp. NBRC 110054]|uniref:DUF2510 domain-containing protein n=1 Tax=Demequina sp. NBRC 110054 TaxID=1570343 RepID=UPI0009FD2F59|nr:DUF2510 domain-containing protein [Demequina sp. NBRC 110054]
MTSTPDPFAAPHESQSGARPGETGAQAVASQAVPPAAWYADPTQPNTVRYWDGAAWTEHTAPAPTSAAQIQPTFATFDTGVDAEAAAARSRRRRRFATVGGVVGSLVVVLGVRLIGSGGFDAVTEFFNSLNGPERTLTATTDGWDRIDVFGGNGTVAVDPEWEDVYDEVGGPAMSTQMSADAGFTVLVEGAWITGTDADGYSKVLYLYAVPELAGATSPKLQVDGFIGDAQVGEENTTTDNGEAVVTGDGLHGYVAEFSYDLYGWSYTDSVGCIVEGRRELLVYVASGSDQLDSGIDDVEAVMNSLTLDD